jgi:hypothetical protein
VALTGLLGMAGFAAWTSHSLLSEQHTETFGAWQATVDATTRAAENDLAVVVEPEVHVFSSYWWSVLEHRGDPTPPMLLSPRAPEPWLGIDRPWVVATVHPHLYWPSLNGTGSIYGGVSEQLRPLTQNRFLEAATMNNPPLPVGRWWSVEQFDDGRPFMWAGPGAELWLPPVPAGTLIGLELKPAVGPEPLRIEMDNPGEFFEIHGMAETTRLWTRTTGDEGDGPVVIHLNRSTGYPPGGGDDRPLVAQLLDVVVRPPGAAWAGSAATEGDRRGLRLELEGGYGAEVFAELGRGVWLGPEARLRLDVDEPGTVEIRIAAPRPTAANPRLVADGAVVAGPIAVDHRAAVLKIPVDDAAVERGAIEFSIESDPYQPAASGGGADTRELGVVLLGLGFKPEHPTKGWWNPPAY